ncbi:MAG: hypothetical protein P4L73_06375 [Caulobacteraceae bacterium]|nr:hypothetical protein [Caulobacteraceae bacterium]
MNSFVPADHRGLWRREVITAPGFRDETTRVLWLQTRTWYVDLRVPADRPAARAGDGFAAYDDAELLALARVQGFAGELAAADGVCFWRRDLDHQPANASPDEARCEVRDDVMIEDGLHADYQEIWRREADSVRPLAAFRLETGQGEGLLVIGGRRMMEFIARPGPAPVGASLAELVAAELAQGRRAAAEALLATRIRYAEQDASGRWIARLSSLPWLEGRPMWPQGQVRFDPRAGVLEAGAGDGRSTWVLADCADQTEALAGLFAVPSEAAP